VLDDAAVRGGEVFLIAFFGRGRMPKVEIDGTTWVDVDSEIILPPDLEQRASPDSVSARVLRDEVLELVRRARTAPN
jgi:hypothetical protein